MPGRSRACGGDARGPSRPVKTPTPAPLAVRHRKTVAALWIVAIVVLLPAARRLPGRLDAGTRITGSESERVVHLMDSAFASPLAHPLLLVVRGLPPGPGGEEGLETILDEVRAVEGVRAVFSPFDLGDPLLRGDEPGSLIVVAGLVQGGSAAAPVLERLTAVTRDLEAGLAGATLRWTGPEALSVDLRRASVADARRSELRAAVPTLLLLVAAFGSVVAALLPLLFGGLAIVTAMGLAFLVSTWWAPSLLLQNVISILGLALGVDYALLVVTRFREALASGLDGPAAAAATTRSAGRTIVLSGTTVALGFASLLLVPVGELRSVAVGGFVVVGVAVLLATTLLPALLAAIGGGIDRGRIPLLPRTADRDQLERWRAWGRWVVRRPVLVLVAAGAPLLLMAAPSLWLRSDVPEKWLPPDMPSAQGLLDLEEIGRGPVASTLTVLLELPEGTVATEGEGWRGYTAVAGALQALPWVQRVRSLPGVASAFPAPPAVFLALAPDSVVRAFVSAGGRHARFEVVPNRESTTSFLVESVRELRAMDAGALAGITGATLLVGGVPAVHADYEDALGSAFGRVVLAVVLGVFVSLLVGFRSVLVPLKATFLNLVSVGAAFGALVVVFQMGWGSRALGVTEPLAGVFPAIPLLAFAIVFGLSMDYEVFLVRRVLEERRARPEAPEAVPIVEGLARTGRVITSAATIMVVIFLAFALGDYLPAKLLGFTLAVAVLVDATLVRLALGPALLQLAGRWNWWPADVPQRRRSGPRSDRPDPGVPPRD